MQKNRYYEDQIISPLRITSIGGYAETAFFLVAMLACGWLVTFEKSVLKLHCRLCTGVFKYLTGITCDVSKRKQAEAEIRQANEILTEYAYAVRAID